MGFEENKAPNPDRINYLIAQVSKMDLTGLPVKEAEGFRDHLCETIELGVHFLKEEDHHEECARIILSSMEAIQKLNAVIYGSNPEDAVH